MSIQFGPQLSLGELIAALERENPDLRLPLGFGNPHSYRGYYEQLAFEPAENVTVRSMLADARGVLGQTLTGYKGGEYRMDEHTDVWLSRYGTTGETIGPVLLRLMLERGVSP